MEKVAKAIIKKDYDSIKNNIQSLDYSDIIKILYLVSNLIIKSLLDDKDSFLCLKYIFKYTSLNMMSFNKAKSLLDIIDKEKFHFTFKIMIFKYNYDLFEQKFQETLRLFIDSQGHIKKLFTEKMSFDEFKDVILDVMQPLIKSFDERKFINSLKMTSIIIKNEDVSEQIWKLINTNEMVDRLCLLVKRFGLNTLMSWKVKCITIQEFISFDFDDQVKYFSKCCRKINNRLNEFKSDILIYSNMRSVLNDMLDKDYEDLEKSDTEDSSTDELSDSDCVDNNLFSETDLDMSADDETEDSDATDDTKEESYKKKNKKEDIFILCKDSKNQIKTDIKSVIDNYFNVSDEELNNDLNNNLNDVTNDNINDNLCDDLDNIPDNDSNNNLNIKN